MRVEREEKREIEGRMKREKKYKEKTLHETKVRIRGRIFVTNLQS